MRKRRKHDAGFKARVALEVTCPPVVPRSSLVHNESPWVL